jgi:hypothetical protein
VVSGFLPLLLVATLASAPSPASVPEADPRRSGTASVPGADTLASNGEQRDARAVRVETPPVIDGRLDDPVWQQAEPLGDFLQRLPNEGAPASQPTEVRILFDEQAIYVGVWLMDSDPAAIVEGPAIRDSRLDDSDAVLLVFDTFRDRQNGFVFGTNP